MSSAMSPQEFVKFPPVKTSLSRRQRNTLSHLLDGDSEKEVAKVMGLSRHTVHVYVKQLYRHYGVRSRAELQSWFYKRVLELLVANSTVEIFAYGRSGDNGEHSGERVT